MAGVRCCSSSASIMPCSFKLLNVSIVGFVNMVVLPWVGVGIVSGNSRAAHVAVRGQLQRERFGRA
jgi:hypothetical protein